MQNQSTHVQTFTYRAECSTVEACVLGDRLVCYLAAPDVQGLCPERVGARGDATDWHGKAIGRYEITARWATPRSYVSSHMLQCIVTLPDGRKYTGRGAGTNMLWRGRLVRSKRGG